jgi:N-acetylneuraminic acid mutarotase
MQDKLWVVAALTDSFPAEKNTNYTYVYDPLTDQWTTRRALPVSRRRGAAATVVIGTKIYVAFGGRGGHYTDENNTTKSVAWFDVYDTITDTWTALPNGNIPRDHTGAVLSDGRICVGGGRVGGSRWWPDVLETECYNFTSKNWSIISTGNVLQKRAGASYGTSCDGKLLMAGGEGSDQAWKNFEMLDGTIWTRLVDLNIARHGSGLAVDCICNQIYIASGAGNQGSGPELYSVETFRFPNQPPCVN